MTDIARAVLCAIGGTLIGVTAVVNISAIALGYCDSWPRWYNYAAGVALGIGLGIMLMILGFQVVGSHDPHA